MIVTLNLLGLCQSLCREAGIAGGEDAISTTQNQTGELGRVVAAIQQSWVDIQTMHQTENNYWSWMRREFKLTTNDSVTEYTLSPHVVDADTDSNIAYFGKWLTRNCDYRPTIYLEADGPDTRSELIYLDWRDFKKEYGRDVTVKGRPAYVSINVAGNTVFSPAPDGVYIMEGEYLESARPLLNDSDIPVISQDFRSIVYWRALTRYGLFESASEAITSGEHYYTEMLAALEDAYLPEIPMAGALC